MRSSVRRELGQDATGRTPGQPRRQQEQAQPPAWRIEPVHEGATFSNVGRDANRLRSPATCSCHSVGTNETRLSVTLRLDPAPTVGRLSEFVVGSHECNSSVTRPKGLRNRSGLNEPGLARPSDPASARAGCRPSATRARLPRPDDERPRRVGGNRARRSVWGMPSIRPIGSRHDDADRPGLQGMGQPDRTRLGQADRLEDRVEPGIIDQVEPAVNPVVTRAVDEEELLDGRFRLPISRDIKAALGPSLADDFLRVGEGEGRHSQDGQHRRQQVPRRRAAHSNDRARARAVRTQPKTTAWIA